MSLHPTVLWAERNDLLYLTVDLSDIKDQKVDLTETKLSFKAKGGVEQKEYAFDIEFLKPVKVEDAKQHLTPRNLFLVIYKKEEGYWNKISKDRLRFVQTDFQRWKDEDDEEEDMGDPMGGLDFQSLMAQAGSSGGLPNMDDLPEGDDSDDEFEEDEQKEVQEEKKD